tara:strand:+ start:868 stop:999 length:132 start_codon:yes stop_codon:yes gene_type:complete
VDIPVIVTSFVGKNMMKEAILCVANIVDMRKTLKKMKKRNNYE